LWRDEIQVGDIGFKEERENEKANYVRGVNVFLD
jgi:hypothetical protein